MIYLIVCLVVPNWLLLCYLTLVLVIFLIPLVLVSVALILVIAAPGQGWHSRSMCRESIIFRACANVQPYPYTSPVLLFHALIVGELLKPLPP